MYYLTIIVAAILGRHEIKSIFSYECLVVLDNQPQLTLLLLMNKSVVFLHLFLELLHSAVVD